MNQFAYLRVLLGAVAFLLAGQTAQAAFFDFLAEANSLERGYSEYVLTVDGVTVTATGQQFLDPFTPYSAYLDSGNAGLGVCKVLNGDNQCLPASDDNLTNGEMLTLEFDQLVDITPIFFKNANHGTNFAANADFEVSVDGGNFVSKTLLHNFTEQLTGTTFSFIIGDFAANGNEFSPDNDELYISQLTAVAAPPSNNQIPEPGTLLLIGLGLFGLGLKRRHSV